MDWKIFFSTFFAFFLAEFGDKTQLVAISMAAKTNKPVHVFLGAVAALALVTAIGVVFGQTVTKIIPTSYVQKGAGVFFLVVGLAILWGKL